MVAFLCAVNTGERVGRLMTMTSLGPVMSDDVTGSAGARNITPNRSRCGDFVCTNGCCVEKVQQVVSARKKLAKRKNLSIERPQ